MNTLSDLQQRLIEPQASRHLPNHGLLPDDEANSDMTINPLQRNRS
ncbi:hypothetical Protein YC6258_00202 [Gynuella sunshinyii YC6258]|uniref:Uncharacterized protein n=1 Tax=Gynuella sunshinyii YC6258 TaxID=1445510 RepID=A0A0C5VPT5_9GAMM|nr:hypothetical Protein YC6258_00202 [Gynuella sunshinyii YC6258]